MDEQQFERICGACDALLAEDGHVLPRVSTPWLHVLNEHPSNLSHYQSLEGPLWPAALKFLARLIGRRVVPALGVAAPPWFTSRPLPARVDILFISHLLTHQHLAMPGDFYFGDLPEQVEAAGRTVSVMVRNHTDLPPRAAVARMDNTKAPRVILNDGIGLRGEVGVALEQWRHCLRLLRGKAEGLLSAVRASAARQLLASATADNLRFYRQVRALVQATEARTLVLTYEGHAWERVAFAAARDANPAVRCIGYHHAVLFPRQHAIARSLGAAFDPDLVVFAGEVARRRFAARSNVDARLEVIGTVRHDPPVHTLERKLNLATAAPACLVVPDGTPVECLHLVGFASACAQLMPDVTFVVRMHPVISFSQLVEADRSLAALPANVVVSNEPIESDFARCSWVVYRGSGAGVRGAATGLRPFYVKAPGETLAIDPLAELTQWRKVVSSPEQLAREQRADLVAPREDLEREFASVRGYLHSYFMPLDGARFTALVAEGLA